MSTKKQVRQQNIDRLSDLIRGTTDKIFQGNRELGFIFWAAQLHLNQAESSPTEDDLLDGMTGGKGDKEVDAYYVDDDAVTVYLFQGKFRSSPATIKASELANFLQSPTRLTNPQALVKTNNERILQFAPLFREKILNGYQLELVLLSIHNATAPIQADAEKWNDDPLVLFVGGEELDVSHHVTISDLDDLLSLFDSAVDQSILAVDLSLKANGFHLAPASGFDCLVATLEAEVLARIFDTYKYRIFRSNPRGPLGSVKVNKEISGTLQDSVKRPWFHLLNNGLSGVCSSFTPPKNTNGEAVTTVQDLQIVNGCQTTYNLWDHWRRGIDLKGTYVTLKLVAAPTLQKDISEASNSQSQMKDWDFLFNDPTQIRLQKEFAELSPPVFYELRRGEYRYIKGGEDQKVTIKDIAQAAWAFTGAPGEAKDKLRDIPRSKGSKSGVYYDIFGEDVPAATLWLPWLTYTRVQQEYRHYFDQTGVAGDFREHGRLHILWLIGRCVIKILKVKSLKEIDLTTVSDLAKQIDSWFLKLHTIAVDATEYVTDVKRSAAEENDQTLSLRQLFRSNASYSDFEKAHDKELSKSGTLRLLETGR